MEATTQPSQCSALCRDQSGTGCTTCGSRVIGLSFAVNVISPLIKGVVGFLGGSQALIADTVHSLSDTASFGVNYLGSRRLTSFAQNIVIGSITFLAGIWVYTDNIGILIIGERARPGLLGAVVGALSVVVNMYLYAISACAYRRQPTTATQLCMLQNKTNFGAAIVALVGMILADFGLTFADPLCAMIIGVLLFTTAFAIFKQAFGGSDPDAPSVRRHKGMLFGVLAALSLGIAVWVTADVINRNDVILVPATGPTVTSPVDPLLGRAHYIMVFHTKTRVAQPIANRYRHFPGDVGGPMAHIVKSHQVDVVLAKKVGQEMFDDLQAAGARIYFIHGNVTVAQAVSQYHKGRFELATAPNVGGGFGRQQVRWLSPW